MNCPRCGKNMTTDDHRKIPLKMCYECGYIEGRSVLVEQGQVTNFAHSKSLNINELSAFLASGLGKEREEVFSWLIDEFKAD